MLGVYFLVWLFGLALIIYWAWRNDAAPLDGETIGMLRMRRPAGAETKAASPLGLVDEADGRVTDQRHIPRHR